MKVSKSTIIFVVAIVFIPAVVFSVAYYFSVSLKSDIFELIKNVNSIEKAISEEPDTDMSVEKFVSDFNKEWDERSERWCFFFDHEEIHQIDSMRAELEAEVKNGMYDAARITSARIKCAFEMMKKHDSLDVSNFF